MDKSKKKENIVKFRSKEWLEEKRKHKQIFQKRLNMTGKRTMKKWTKNMPKLLEKKNRDRYWSNKKAKS